MQTDQGCGTSLAADEPQPRHYCRGCGKQLPAGFRGQFHRQCLRDDKRRRIREQRQREQERFQRWLDKQRCLKCGAKYSDQRSDGAVEASCEASQPSQEREPPVE